MYKLYCRLEVSLVMGWGLNIACFYMGFKYRQLNLGVEDHLFSCRLCPRLLMLVGLLRV